MKTIVSFLSYFFLLIMAGLSLHRCLLWEPERLDAPCPTITGFSPSGAPFGGIVTVTGSNFIARSPDFHTVKIGETLVPVDSIIAVSENGDSLLFKVPKGIGNGKISVTLTTAPGCTEESDKEFNYYYTVSSANIIAGILNMSNCSDCLNSPQGLDLNANGDIYVADRNHHMIQMVKITPAGNDLVPIAGRRDSADWRDDLSDGLFAEFNAPSDIAVDENDNIYVADEFNHRIRMIDNSSRRGVKTISGGQAEFVDNVPVINGRYIRPTGIATDSINRLFVSEYTGHRVRELDLSTSGVVKTIATGTNAPSATGLNFPAGVAYSPSFSADFSVLVADRGNKLIRGIGSNNLFNITDIQSTFFSQLYGIALDNKGNIFVTDQGRKEVIVIYPDKEMKVIAGNGVKYTFNTPSGIVFDNDRNIIYVSDSGTHVVVKLQLE